MDNREPWELALDLANRTREPIMAFVCVEGVQLTGMMDDLTFDNDEVSQAAREFLCVRVDVFRPENGPFLDRFGVRRANVETDESVKVGGAHAYPVTLFIAPNGTAEHMVYGFVTADALLKVMGEAREVIGLREGLEKAPDDAKALARLGALYVELQRYEAGREVLEKALQLDADHALGVGETALLDLAIAVMAESDYTRAIELLTTHIGTFPGSQLRCKAQYLLGAPLLAGAEETQLRAEELAAADDAEAAALGRESAQVQRKQVVEAWQWFEAGEDRTAPCADSEWSKYALGALEALRVEVAFRTAANLGAGGDYRGGVQALRAFVKEHREKQDAEGAAGRIYDAEFLIGEYLMSADKHADAADHWRGFIDRYPPRAIPDRLGPPEFEDTCEAMFLLGECLLRIGKREQAMTHWQALASDDRANPCRATPWPARATSALEAPANE